MRGHLFHAHKKENLFFSLDVCKQLHTLLCMNLRGRPKGKTKQRVNAMIDITLYNQARRIALAFNVSFSSIVNRGLQRELSILKRKEAK
ncbi:hypothetical protein [Geminisphaera colitermitum]|uniref:hypothetical protein n=1 Tax=Geminisphaera colitermitum TaxID=1148786 RepID=UPI0012FEDE90|nr:hypothetical protein [Geminisphaera colitermitum]